MIKTFAWTTLLLLVSTGAMAQEWGNLKMRFLLDGTPPAAKKLDVTKDVEFCGKFDLKEETFAVGKGGELANVVVYLSPKLGSKPKIHPSYEEQLKRLMREPFSLL